MPRISIRSVLVGAVVDVLSSVVLGLPLAIYAMSKTDLAAIPRTQASAAVTTAIHGNPVLYIGQLLVGLLCSMLGGCVAGWLAKHDELLNAGLSSFLCLALGVHTLASGRDSNPLWSTILLVFASPLAAVIGGAWMKRVRRTRLHSVVES